MVTTVGIMLFVDCLFAGACESDMLGSGSATCYLTFIPSCPRVSSFVRRATALGFSLIDAW